MNCRVCSEVVHMHKVIESTCNIGLIVHIVVLSGQSVCAHNNIFICVLKGLKRRGFVTFILLL
jgi:hypothetical protein